MNDECLQALRKLLQARIDEHREAIRERSRWIKEHRPEDGVQHTPAVYSEYASRKKRWNDVIQDSHVKMDEVRHIARIAGLDIRFAGTS